MKTPKSIVIQLFSKRGVTTSPYEKLRTAGLAFEKEGNFEQAINSYLMALDCKDKPKSHDLTELIKRANQLATDQLKVAKSNTLCALAEIAFQREALFPSFSTYRLIEEAYFLNPDSNKIKSLYLNIVQYFRPSLIIGKGIRGVKGFGFSKDGKYVITSEKNGAILVWEVSATNDPIVLEGHKDEIIKATFNKDNTKVLTYSEDDTIRIWPLSNPENHIILGVKERRLKDVFFSEKESHVLAVRYDGSIIIWMQNDLNALTTLYKEDKSEDEYYDVSFSKDEQQVLACSSRQAWVWKLTAPAAPILLEGHIDNITSATFNENGDKVLTTCQDGSIRVWPLSNPNQYIKLKAGYGTKGALLNKAQTQVLSWGYDNTIRIWQLSDRKNTITLEGHFDHFYGVQGAVFSTDENHVLSWGFDDTVRIWNLSDTENPIVLKHNVKSVYDAVFINDGERILSNCNDHTVRIWNLFKPENPILLTGHTKSIKTIVFDKDVRKVLTTSEDDTARIWSTDKPLFPKTFEMPLTVEYDDPDIQFYGARYNKNETSILIWCAYGIWLWSPQTHDDSVFMDCSDKEIYGAKFSDDEQSILSWGAKGAHRIWSLSNLHKPTLIEDRTFVIYDIDALEYENQSIIISQNEINIWEDFSAESPITIKYPEEITIINIRFSDDGKLFMACDDHQYMAVWKLDAPQDSIVLKMDEGKENKSIIGFSPNNKYVLASCENKEIMVWELAKPDKQMILTHNLTKIFQVRFSSDSKFVVGWSYDDDPVLLWSLSGDPVPILFKGHKVNRKANGRNGGQVSSVIFSPNKKYILSWSHHAPIRVWDVNDPESPIIFKGHTNEVWEACFSKDSNRILSYGLDGTVRIWNLADPQHPIILEHKAHVKKAFFNKDERHVLSYTHEAVHIWNIDHPQEPLILKPESNIISAHFNQEETQVLICSPDTVYVWDLDVKKVMAKLYKQYPTMMKQPLLDDWKQQYGLEGHYKELMS